MYTIDIDVGGTFTDGFFSDGEQIRTTKVLTTPHDITECVLASIEEASSAFGVEIRSLLRRTLVVRLSTTLGTNTMVQRKGPKIGLLVTSGQETRLYTDKDNHLVPDFLSPEMIVGVAESVDASGTVLTEVARDDVLAGIRHLSNLGVRMIAVSFANSWRNPSNERKVRDFVREQYPVHYLRSVPMQLGTDVAHVADDNARTNSVVINSYIHTDVARALYRVDDALHEKGYGGHLLAVHANGGNARVAKTVALNTLGSGPAVATRGAAKMAALLNLPKVITADMGGTSLDTAVLLDQNYELDVAPRFEGVPLATPMIAVDSIGAGGGTIAKCEGGVLKVGPDSAGSVPGPVCYSRGGLEPTITDANLVLGYIDSDFFLGGRMQLDIMRARKSIERRVARPLGIAVEDAAYRIRAAINDEMARELDFSVRRQGYDPSEFTLFSMGGAGPLHACVVAAGARMDTVVTFPFGSVFSAFGGSTTNVQHLYGRTLSLPLDQIDSVDAELDGLQRQALSDMAGEGFEPDEVSFQIEIDVSYQEEVRTIRGGGSAEIRKLIDENVSVDRIADGRLDSIRLWCEGEIVHWQPTAVEATPNNVEVARKGVRNVFWKPDAPTLTTVYDREQLGRGHVIEGPAIVEGTSTNYVVDPGWVLTIDEYTNLRMARQ